MKLPVTLVSAGLLAVTWLSSAAADDTAAKRAAQQQAIDEAEPAAPAPKPAAPHRAPRRPAGGAQAAAADGKAMDRLELERTQITGNRELPKVMVIVPWKRSDIGDLVGRPVNSLVDEVLQPVDREVFRREINYYGALSAEKATTETQVTGSPGQAEPRPER